MRIAANRGVGGIGDPSLEARRRWPVCGSLGLPIASWHLRGLDADALEALLSDDGQRADYELHADAGIMKIVRGASGTTAPAELVAQLQALALDRDPPPAPVPTVDRADPLASVALGCVGGIEAHAVDLLGRDDARALLAWIERRLPRTYWAKLASVIRVSVDLARQRAIEILVDLETLDVERQERERLEAPAREAAQRIQAAAAAARARIEAEAS